MRRRLNRDPWLGFFLIVAAFLSYIPVFVRFPSTRDSPWPILLMFAAGLVLIARGLTRAVRRPDLYRGRVAGPILAILGLAISTFFVVGMFHFARQIPPSSAAPRAGRKAPDFTLPDQDGHPVTLSRLLDSGQGGAGRLDGVVLIFYRGDW
jgi:hypothetical protein